MLVTRKWTGKFSRERQRRVTINALDAAIRLHDFIRSNAGETADWPLQITSRDRGAVERLDTLLREFHDSVMT
jgi:hypothetical protein